MPFNFDTYGKAAGLGGIGAGLAGMFMNNNPADEAMPYLEGIPGKLSPYFDPYMKAGERALGAAEGEFGKLIGNPGGRLNEIGGSFQESPGFKFALQQALQGAGHGAAAGGMAGSPMHEQQNMGLATNLANQDYYNWLGKATGLYGAGLSGMQDIYGTGFNASKSMADQIAQAMAAQSMLKYMGEASENEAMGGAFGNIAGGLGTLAAFL